MLEVKNPKFRLKNGLKTKMYVLKVCQSSTIQFNLIAFCTGHKPPICRHFCLHPAPAANKTKYLVQGNDQPG